MTYIVLGENRKVGLDARVTARERAAANFITSHGLPGLLDLSPGLVLGVLHTEEHAVSFAGILI